MSKAQAGVVGVAFVERTDWTWFRKKMADGRRFPLSYDDWLRSFTDGVQSIREAGNAVERVSINRGVFEAWCEEHGHDLDGVGRAKFAAAMVDKRSRSR